MINIIKIEDVELNNLLNKYEQSLFYLKNPPFFIENLINYSLFINRLLKTIQGKNDSLYDEIMNRIDFNRDFEEQLLNHGNSVSDIPPDYNAKLCLFNLAQKLKDENKKSKMLLDKISQNLFSYKKTLIICNSFDEIFINDYLNYSGMIDVDNIRVIRFRKFMRKKELEYSEFFILGYSLDGFRDFEFYHNLPCIINLILYDREIELYKDCLNKYKRNLENELLKEDRYFISGLIYDKPPDLPLTLSQSLQNIIDNVTNLSNREFDELKDDPDIHNTEILGYTIEYEGLYELDILKSSDTVFNHLNQLIRVSRLQIEESIRVYNLDFGEILVQTAIDLQGEKFQEIDKYSNLWKRILRDLFYQKYKENIELLFLDLKKYGLSILQSTLYNNWIYGLTKFPRRKEDLKAIYELSKDIELGASMGLILEAKRIYTSVMIALGRDLKEEIKIFLTEGTLGEILVKNNIQSETLKKTINKQMPLKKIKNITSRIIKAEDYNA